MPAPILKEKGIVCHHLAADPDECMLCITEYNRSYQNETINARHARVYLENLKTKLTRTQKALAELEEILNGK